MSIVHNKAHDPFSFQIWEPFHDLLDFGGPIIAPPLAFPHQITPIVSAKIDWKETPEAHVLKLDLPGLRKEEVKLEVEEGNILRISGERKIEKEEKNENWHRVERSRSNFIQRFSLPENAKIDKMKTHMENGVLSITIPKGEIKKKNSRAIHIS